MSSQLSFWDDDFNPAMAIFEASESSPPANSIDPVVTTVTPLAETRAASNELADVPFEDAATIVAAPASTTPLEFVAHAASWSLPCSTITWPEISSSLHTGLRGSVSKFNANIEAIRLLIDLERRGASPTESERALLNCFTGWGGIKDPFEVNPQGEWRERSKALKSLLSEEDFESASDSILSAHFTPIALIKRIWALVEALGFKGGRVLDPSGGTGYFIGAMPSHLAAASSITAVELDSVNARILKALYGKGIEVHHSGLEKLALPESFYDAIVTNVPFGEYSVGDQRRKIYSGFNIHNYFIARSLDLVRPGGLVVVLTSSHFMDATNDKVRKYIARQGKLIGAIRLPAGTFSQTANTDVVVDLVVFQRRETHELLKPSEVDQYVVTAPLCGPDGVPFLDFRNNMQVVNRYWLDNRENVLGEWTQYTHRHGSGFRPTVNEGQNYLDLFDNAAGTFPQGIYREAKPQQRVVDLGVGLKNREHPIGSYVAQKGKVMVASDRGLIDSDLKGIRLERVRGLIGIRDSAKALILEMSKLDGDERVMDSLRFELNVRYDAFVQKYGFITTNGNRKVMARDASWPLLLSLEIFDPDTLQASKADIFRERTVFSKAIPTSAESPADALAISIAELGLVDADFIGRLMACDGQKAIRELLDQGLLFENPETSEFETKTDYLSGNVRKKLSAAVNAGDRFARNVEALKSVIPADLKPSQIDLMPGMTWIPTSDSADFLKHLLSGDYSGLSWATYEVSFNAASGSYQVKSHGPHPTNSVAKWGTTRFSPAEVLEACMNSEDLTANDLIDGKYVINAKETALARMRQDEVRAEFKTWMWLDEGRSARLAAIYNEMFNCWAPPVYDGSHLRLPGYSHALPPRSHQLNAAARMATGKNVILSHCVGAGKTLTMCMGTMEIKRLGIAKKPWHVVQNSTLEQYTAEFVRAYPNANLLMATKADTEPSRRREFAARAATGNWDAVVITHSAFEKLAPDQDITEAYIEASVEDIKLALEDRPDRVTARTLRKTLKDWEAKLERMQAIWKKDTFIPLSATGCDYLAIDEAHCFKNLAKITRMKNITGLSNSNSQRALDMFLKCRQIMHLHGGKERGVAMASGTIISNSIGEMFTFQQFTQPQLLETSGLDTFDAWASQFGRAVTSLEVAPDGSSFRMAKRFKQFANVPELMGLFKQTADVQTADMLNLPVPALVTGKEQVCVVQPSSFGKAYIKSLVTRAERIQSRAVTPKEDNMLAVTGDGLKVALDERLVMPELPYNPEGKIGKCVDNVLRIWKMTSSFKGAQLIFCDRGTPSGGGLNLYQTIKDELVGKGVPEGEIAFIHDYDSDSAKALLYSKIRAGVIRVLVGSTEKCGTGTNIQTRLYAVHHLTTPWRPADLEQRNGRIKRQGNTCEAIEIWTYIVEGSFDAYAWQTLSAKAGFIGQVLCGNAELRTVEDALMATLTYEEVKGLASGNPMVREKAILDAEILQLAMQKRQHADSVWTAKRDLASLPNAVKKFEEEAQFYRQWASALEADGSKTTLVVGDRRFVEADTVSEILTLLIEEGAMAISGGSDHYKLGVLNGMDLWLVSYFDSTRVTVQYQRSHWEVLGVYRSGRGVLGAIEKLQETVRNKGIRAAQSAEFWITREPSLVSLVDSTFDKSDVLDAKIARSREIAIEIGLLKNTEGTEALDEKTAVSSAAAAEHVDQCLSDETDMMDEESVQDFAPA